VNIGALYQVKITGSAKGQTSTSFYSLGGQTWRMEFPSRSLKMYFWIGCYSSAWRWWIS